MLAFLYEIYRNSSNRLKALKELGAALGEKLPRPVKASGLIVKPKSVNSSKVILTSAPYPWLFILMSYLFCGECLSVEQKEQHDPVKAVRRIQ